jgi:hypothetical protein
MSSDILMDKILKDIKSCYGDMNSPNYSFLMKNHSLFDYNKVIDKLRSIFSIEEFSDFNYEVTRSFLLKKDKKKFSMYLSLVGRYSFVLSKHGKVLDEVNIVDSEESEIIRIIKLHNICLLNKELLLASLPYSIYSVCLDQEINSVIKLVFAEEMELQT